MKQTKYLISAKRAKAKTLTATVCSEKVAKSLVARWEREGYKVKVTAKGGLF